MDAKVGDWVVTPRRGKAVEINALWYNALRLLEEWLEAERGPVAAKAIGEYAARAATAFNARFWYAPAATSTTWWTASTATTPPAGRTRCWRSR
jgi:predicted glycogen debranching enzyme